MPFSWARRLSLAVVRHRRFLHPLQRSRRLLRLPRLRLRRRFSPYHGLQPPPCRPRMTAATSSDTLLDPENPAFSPELWPWSHHVVRMGDIDITPQDQAALKHLWGDAILHHPIAWLIHRVSVFRQVIGSPYSDGSSVMMEPNDSPEWLANAYGHSPERTKLQNYIRWWLTNLVRHRFFKPWMCCRRRVGTTKTPSSCEIGWRTPQAAGRHLRDRTETTLDRRALLVIPQGRSVP